MTISKARKILKKGEYTDEEIEKIIILLEKLALIEYDSFQNTMQVEQLYQEGLTIEEAKKKLAEEGLIYDDRALMLIKEKMDKKTVQNK